MEQFSLSENTWNSSCAVWLNLHHGTATYSLKTFAACFYSTTESYHLFIFCCLAPKLYSGSRVKILEIYVYSLLGFLLCEVLFFRHMDTSTFIKSLCRCLRDLNCDVFFSSLPTSWHFEVIFWISIKNVFICVFLVCAGFLYRSFRWHHFFPFYKLKWPKAKQSKQ